MDLLALVEPTGVVLYWQQNTRGRLPHVEHMCTRMWAHWASQVSCFFQNIPVFYMQKFRAKIDTNGFLLDPAEQSENKAKS